MSNKAAVLSTIEDRQRSKNSLESLKEFIEESLQRKEESRKRIILDIEDTKRNFLGSEEYSFPYIDRKEEQLKLYDKLIAEDNQRIAELEQQLAEHNAKMSNQR